MFVPSLLIPPLLHYHFFYRGPLTFQNNLAERLGVAHMPVQILSCLKERIFCDLMMIASEQIKLSYTAVV